MSTESYSFGLTAGYSAPLGRHFRLDFTLGGGYVKGKQYEYRPAQYSDKYVLQEIRQIGTIAPTNVGISLIWLMSGKQGKEVQR
jgi:hypothetical protein